MARINKLTQDVKSRYTIHKPTDATYFILTDEKGRKYLQIETVGSEDRQFKGKVSQSVQFSPEAINQLKDIIKTNF